MPKVRPIGPPTHSGSKNHTIDMALCCLGMDMVGQFKRARGAMTHLLVAVDKFTKWVEAEPIKKLDGDQVPLEDNLPIRLLSQHHHRQWHKFR